MARPDAHGPADPLHDVAYDIEADTISRNRTCGIGGRYPRLEDDGSLAPNERAVEAAPVIADLDGQKTIMAMRCWQSLRS